MGIFDNIPETQDLYTAYKVDLQFRDKIVGGIPLDPKIVQNWLASRMGDDDRNDLKIRLIQTLQERGVPIEAEMSFEEIIKLAEEFAETRNANGFKRDEPWRTPNRGLYIESRIVKAAIKEVTSILYTGAKWGQRAKKGGADGEMIGGKSPKSMMAERAFVEPQRIYLGVMDPTGIDTFVGHVMTMQGPRSTLTRYEFVYQPKVTFYVAAAEDFVKFEDWAKLWRLCQDNGIGSLRSQGHGTFDVIGWTKVSNQEWNEVRETSLAQFGASTQDHPIETNGVVERDLIRV